VEADNRAIEEALALMQAESERVRNERRRMVDKVRAARTRTCYRAA
jgi:hypothetical protein